MIRYFCLCIAFLLPCRAADSLGVHAMCNFLGVGGASGGEARFYYEVFFYIKNNSDREVTLPTGGYLIREKVRGDEIIFNLVYPEHKALTGGSVKVSPVVYAPVVLSPGETTEIRFKVDSFQNRKKLYVTYEVPPEFRRMYSFWVGRLEVYAGDVASYNGEG